VEGVEEDGAEVEEVVQGNRIIGGKRIRVDNAVRRSPPRNGDVITRNGLGEWILGLRECIVRPTLAFDDWKHD